jgi:hypothetical protein
LVLEKVNVFDKPLINLSKMRRQKAQINKIRNEKRELKINTKEIQGIIRDYFQYQINIQINWKI